MKLSVFIFYSFSVLIIGNNLIKKLYTQLTIYVHIVTRQVSHLTTHGKKMHVKEIYVIFIHLFDSGILLIIDLNKKKKGKGGGEFYL